MTETPITTDLDRDPAWWSAWFDEDYSWDGLTKKDWQGWVVVEGRCVPKDQVPEGQDWPRASLQDYWRADPDHDWILRDMPAPGEALSDAELIDLGGTIWHRAHLPPATQNGERSWKADPADPLYLSHWENLTTDLQTRLKHGFETQVKFLGVAVATDGRLQGAGLVLKSLPQPGEDEETPLHLSMPHACFLGDIRMENAQFGPGANFHSASFGGDAYFNSASFGGDAYFNSASFGGDANFYSASFGGDANFNSASFGEYANFTSASFGGDAWFESASFGEYANFTSASFGEDATFHSASFGGYADFESASFGGFANFHSASFGGAADFHSASFGGYAWFDSASFGEDARFSSAVFLGRVGFQRGGQQAQMAGRLVQGQSEADVREGLSDPPKDNDYVLALTHGAANREMGAFKTLYMSGAYCLEPLDFSDRVFGQAPSFAGMICAGVPKFYRAELHDGVNLKGASFRHDDPAGILSWDQLVERLKDRPGFRGQKGEADVPSVKALRVAWDNRSLKKDQKHPELANPFWRAAFIAWRNYARRLPPSNRPEDPTGLNWSDVSDRDWRTAVAEDAPGFEQGYRRLKLLMGGMGAHIEEQRFFACELRARQTRNPKTDNDIKTWEVLAARAYGALADYGRSAVRPVFWLGALWAGFFLVYASLAVGSCALPETGCPVRYQIAEGVDRANPPTQLMEEYAVLPQLRRDLFALTWAGGKVLSEGVMNGPFLFAAELTIAPVANPIRHHEWAQSLVERGDGWSTLFGFARWLHRVLALPLIFLFALALRRRFQLG